MKFRFIIEHDVVLEENEIFINWDKPRDPTVADVQKLVDSEVERVGLMRFIKDWNLIDEYLGDKVVILEE